MEHWRLRGIEDGDPAPSWKERREKEKTRKKENYYVVQQKYEGLTSMREGLWGLLGTMK